MNRREFMQTSAVGLAASSTARETEAFVPGATLPAVISSGNGFEAAGKPWTCCGRVPIHSTL